MPTPWDHFRKDMFAAIHASMFYPKEAISEGAQGQVVVAFDYFDGKASNFSVADSSGDRFLDAAALRAFERANLPGPLPQFGGRLMHFNMGICYSLGSSTICSTTRDVLEIVNTPPAQTP
ncbi:MAG TPA: TonB family protein, partial [Gammaproteobacteria bacterium]|jgi:TonB family protein